jgi:outer membrane protein TolC
MKLFALASVVLSISLDQGSVSTLTFDDALALAGQQAAPSAFAPLRTELSGLRRSRLPDIRAEVLANTSRTLDLFAEGPLENRFATSVLAFDYPLWDGGITGRRIDLIEARLRRLSDQGRMDDARFAQLVEAFGELYFAQQQIDGVRALSEKLAAEATRSESLLAEGEISNLMALERREIALAFASRLLDLEARRIDAAARLRQLTRVEGEPILMIDLTDGAPLPAEAGAPSRDDRVEAMSLAVEESRARLRDAGASTSLRATLSGFLGVGAAQSEFRDITSDGSFGVYGLRVLLSYPLFRGATSVPIVEARADLAQNLAYREEAVRAAEARAAEYRLRAETSTKRIALLQQSVEAAKRREESLQRLVTAGVRSESDLALAQAERARREGDLLAAAIDRWKATRLLGRMIAAERP